MNRASYKSSKNKKMVLKLFKLSLIIIVVFLIQSCSHGETRLHHFKENQWDFNDTIVFSFDIIDTSKTKNITFFFRNTLNYSYRNLFLLVETQYASSTIEKDTAQYLVSNKYGQWLGRGLGKTKDNYFIFNERMHFKKPGHYKIIVKHGMRDNPLIGVNALGLKIE
tara:strand:+ start:1174 stop:1671 length:498 start_codon:yes stop_codon:yes gene_type:complete